MTDFYQLSEDEQAEAMAVLASAALFHWGLEGSELSLIKYRENGVFKVRTQEGIQYALRIHRYGYHSDDELRSELQWMSALDEFGIAVPHLLPTLDGSLFALVSAAQVPEPRQVDLFAWVDGEPLGSVEEGMGDQVTMANSYHTIGGLAARLHNQASAWTPPANFTRHAWNVEGLVGDQPFWSPFWELESLTEEERALLLEARERVRVDLTAYGQLPESAACYSMIHADFVTENIMVDGDCVRLIDFDDAGFGWHLFELATALYFEMGEAHYETAYTALIAGYRENRALSDAQLDYFPLFLLVRSFTYLGWVHTRAETQTARELTPMLVEKCCGLAREYLRS
jgi:Ser/Thr protein kinase RdoA (MazF antagonist)